jgi:hypothetical protein
MSDQNDRKRIRDNIKKFGWHVTLVLERNSLPGWGYSIGFYETFKHAEVVIFGLPKDATHSIINFIGEDIKSGKHYEADKEYPDILEGAFCRFQTVESVWLPPLLGRATSYYDSRAFPVLQCIWPDKNQHYPWDSEFRRDWLWAQPLLFHSEPNKANVEELLRSLNITPQQGHLV